MTSHSEELKKTEDFFLGQMAAILGDEPEGRHLDADDILCDALKALGWTRLASMFRSFEKWYA